jgi:hypothetical protein
MKKLLVVLMLMSASGAVRAQMLAVKTNALMDLGTVANLGLEVATGSRTSVCVNGFGSWNIYGLYAKTYGVSPEFRYWMSGNTFSKFFMGVGATLMHFDVIAKQIRFRGSAVGPGLNFGYSLWLSNHFSVEFHGGVGVYYNAYSRTKTDDILPTIPDINQRTWQVYPYQLGVSFVYIIK